MANGLKVDPAEMLRLGKETIEKSVDLKEQIENLTTNKNNLMEIWHGDAAKTFGEMFANQMANLTAFDKLIEELGTKINSGANTFHENEEENVSDAKKLED